MHMYGSTPEQFATIAATIRNNGHVHPGRHLLRARARSLPTTSSSSRMVADPYHLLDCAMTSEGGSAIVLARADRVADLPHKPVYVLGGIVRPDRPVVPARARVGPHRQAAPTTCPTVSSAAAPLGAASRPRGLTPDDVDMCEFYDPFSFEIIRQFEAFGFCGRGRGRDRS